MWKPTNVMTQWYRLCSFYVSFSSQIGDLALDKSNWWSYIEPCLLVVLTVHFGFSKWSVMMNTLVLCSSNELLTSIKFLLRGNQLVSAEIKQFNHTMIVIMFLLCFLSQICDLALDPAALLHSLIVCQASLYWLFSDCLSGIFVLIVHFGFSKWSVMMNAALVLCSTN